MMELFSPDFLFRNALFGGLGVALFCALLGVYLVLRRLVLIGVALPQASAAGIAAAFWISGHAHGSGGGGHGLALAGSGAATFGALALLVLGRRRSRTPAEWAVGALFAICSAATILFVAVDPRGDLEMTNLLRGDLLAIAGGDLEVIGGVLALVVTAFFLFRRELLLASFDPEFARTIERHPSRYDALLYGLIGAGIALGVMNAGPLFVFGFLVLPPLAALRVAPGLASALALAALLGAAAFLGGFAVAYRADLPVGPSAVAVAAGFWVLGGIVSRLRGRRLAAAVVVLATLAGLSGCSSMRAAREARAREPLPRGSLPALDPPRPIAVLRFENQTGQALVLASPNPLHDLPRAAGDPFADPPQTVCDALEARAGQELARRGYPVLAPIRVRSVLPQAFGDPARAAEAVKGALGPEPVALVGVLRRFTVTQTGLLLVRLDLALVDPATGRLLWSGSARRPVPIESALTDQEVLLDAAGPLFAEAFGSR
jgi:ABC-type Mn2+/Zn2+ transport system permease subunit